MLSKSKKSAVVLAIIAILSGLLTSLILAVIPHILAGEILLEAIAQSLFQFVAISKEFLTVWNVLLSVVVIWAVSGVIYDKAHFGVGGAIRWAIMGIVCTLSFQFFYWTIPSAARRPSAARSILGYAILLLNYWLVFKSRFFTRLVPLDEQLPNATEDSSSSVSSQLATDESTMTPEPGSLVAPESAPLWWFLVIGGTVVLLIGLTALPTSSADPYPYLGLSIVTMGLTCILFGTGMLLLPRKLVLGSLIVLLGIIGFIAFLYWDFRSSAHIP